MRLRFEKLALVTLTILDTKASLSHVLKFHDLEMDLIRITNHLSLGITIVTLTLRITTASILNWKNNKGFTIPLDKRLAADGRGLQDVCSNKFPIPFLSLLTFF